MFYQLPPVGNLVQLRRQVQDSDALARVFSPYIPRLLDSGTAALAAAVAAAVSLKDTDKPEVILPAYGCPDLVSAVLHAGARPVLADLEPERPWLDPARVAEAISPHTVAMVAVSLFGIPERMDILRPLAEQAGALLIEDSAQAFPCDSTAGCWRGDLVVLSFGRGKPVSLLGGGAVLFRDERFAGLLPDTDDRGSIPGGNAVALGVKAWLYNRMLSPRIYWLPQVLPFLHLGETRFHPLPAVKPMDANRRSLLPANIAAYCRRHERGVADIAALVAAAQAGGRTGFVDLPAACGYPAPNSLLRYPLLLARDARDTVHDRLRRLGASRMYPAVLPAIEGLETLLADAGAFPAASDFAARLLTLPLHGRVSDSDLAALRDGLG